MHIETFATYNHALLMENARRLHLEFCVIFT